MISGLSRKLVWMAAVSSGLLCSTVNAQDLEEFRTRMNDAAAMSKQDMVEALQQYLEIHVKYSGPEIDYSLGRAYQRMGQCSDALQFYSNVMGYNLPNDNVVLQRAIKTYDEISSCESWQKITLKCDMPQDSYIMLDDVRFSSCWSRPISLSDGDHTLKLVSANGKETSQTVHAKSGQPTETVTLAFKTEKEKDSEKDKSTAAQKIQSESKEYILKDKFHPALYWGLITGGVAVMGVGGVFFGLAHKSYADEQKYADLFAINGNEADRKKAKDARDKVKLNNILTYSMLGVGGAAAITGAVLAIVNAVSDKERVEITDGINASVTPTDGGFAVGFGMNF